RAKKLRPCATIRLWAQFVGRRLTEIDPAFYRRSRRTQSLKQQPQRGAQAAKSDLNLEQVGMHGAFGDLVDGAGHHDGEVVADLDADLAAGHVDGELAVDEAEFVRDGGGGARAAPGREGVAGAAFP